MTRSAGTAAAALLALALPGCLFLPGPRKEYIGEERVLEAAGRAAGFVPDGSWYRPIFAEVAPDSITFQYEGVENPGDRAWAIRFSVKSTEQRPDAVASLDTLVEAIAKGKDGFEVLGRERRDPRGLPVEVARYRYRSPLRNDRGNRLLAAGAAALLRIDRAPAPVVYQFNVENAEGDRPVVGWRELEPLVDAVLPE